MFTAPRSLGLAWGMCRTYLAECLGPQHRRIFTPNTEASTLGRGMGAYSPQYTNSAEQRLCRKYQVSPLPLVLPVDTSPLPPPASTGTRTGSSVCGTTLVPTRPRRRKWHFCVAGVFKSVLDVLTLTTFSWNLSQFFSFWVSFSLSLSLSVSLSFTLSLTLPLSPFERFPCAASRFRRTLRKILVFASAFSPFFSKHALALLPLSPSQSFPHPTLSLYPSSPFGGDIHANHSPLSLSLSLSLFR